MTCITFGHWLFRHALGHVPLILEHCVFEQDSKSVTFQSAFHSGCCVGLTAHTVCVVVLYFASIHHWSTLFTNAFKQ